MYAADSIYFEQSNLIIFRIRCVLQTLFISNRVITAISLFLELYVCCRLYLFGTKKSHYFYNSMYAADSIYLEKSNHSNYVIFRIQLYFNIKMFSQNVLSIEFSTCKMYLRDFLQICLSFAVNH